MSHLSSLGMAWAGVAGVAVGVLGAVFFVPGLVHSGGEHGHASELAHEAPRSLAPANGNDSAQESARVSALEQRLAALEQRPMPAVQTNAPTLGAAAKDPETAAADERATFQGALDAHELEPRNTPWGNRASPELTADLGKLAQQGNFSLDRVDCRASTCTAEVDWASEAEARAGWHALLTYEYGVNCQRNVLLREEPDARGRTHADLIFDCTGAAQASN